MQKLVPAKHKKSSIRKNFFLHSIRWKNALSFDQPGPGRYFWLLTCVSSGLLDYLCNHQLCLKLYTLVLNSIFGNDPTVSALVKGLCCKPTNIGKNDNMYSETCIKRTPSGECCSVRLIQGVRLIQVPIDNDIRRCQMPFK